MSKVVKKSSAGKKGSKKNSKPETAENTSATELPTETPKVAPVPEQKEETESTNGKESPVLYIAHARTRCFIDKLGINKKINEEIAPLKEIVQKKKASKKALDDETEEKPIADDEKRQHQSILADPLIKNAEEKIAGLSREKTRFSNEAAPIVSIIFDELVMQLFLHARKNAESAEKKNVSVEHIYKGDYEGLSLFPLIAPLPAVKEQIAGLGKTTPATTNTKTENNPAEDDAEENGNVPPAFKFYIGNIYKAAQNNRPAKSTRVSSSFCSHVNDILVQLCGRLVKLLMLTASSMKTKTISETTVKRVVETILVDCTEAVEKISYTVVRVEDPSHKKSQDKLEDAAKSAGEEFERSDAQMVDQYIAEKKVSFPNSGYPALEKIIDEKLRKWKEQNKADSSASGAEKSTDPAESE